MSALTIDSTLDDDRLPCPDCDATGFTSRVDPRMPYSTVVSTFVCVTCRGAGRISPVLAGQLDRMHR